MSHAPTRRLLLRLGPVLCSLCLSLLLWLPAASRLWTLVPLFVGVAITAYALGYDDAVLDAALAPREESA